ncbi:MAG TPA: ribosomal protein S18-alanine N-acetyltransferase [Bryobacteraceae bacterium]|nr:ribosomal protein S18-alanine N-acetyltransferase [Bryobacteraceae bacterium]
MPAIVRIEKASFGAGAWKREDFLRYLFDPERSIFLVAAADGKVAGYVIGFITGTRAEVDSIAVTPSRRGVGIAGAIMTRLRQMLQRRGVTTISLTVRVNNTAAIGLYRKLGFRRERRINDYYEDGAPAWRMKSALG